MGFNEIHLLYYQFIGLQSLGRSHKHAPQSPWVWIMGDKKFKKTHVWDHRMGVFIWYEGGWDYDLIGINSIYKQPFYG